MRKLKGYVEDKCFKKTCNYCKISQQDRQKILTTRNRLKIAGISEDLSNETLKIRNENWDRKKALWKEGRYTILVYDRIYTR